MSLNFIWRSTNVVPKKKTKKKKKKKNTNNASEADALVSDVLVSSIEREMGPQINLPIWSNIISTMVRIAH